jgi:hypothetical protein
MGNQHAKPLSACLQVSGQHICNIGILLFMIGFRETSLRIVQAALHAEKKRLFQAGKRDLVSLIGWLVACCKR